MLRQHRLKEGWQGELGQWKERSSGLEVVYLWVDGVYVKAGLEEKAALLVAIGGLSDGQKVVLAAEPGYRESTESWSDMLRDLKQRGMNSPRVVVRSPGYLGSQQRLVGEQWNRSSMCWTSCPGRSRQRPRGHYRRAYSVNCHQPHRMVTFFLSSPPLDFAVQEGGQRHGGHLG